MSGVVCILTHTLTELLEKKLIPPGSWSNPYGNAVNRRLIKLHELSSNVIYKVCNTLHRKIGIIFFSDPPHLVKTVRTAGSQGSIA